MHPHVNILAKGSSHLTVWDVSKIMSDPDIVRDILELI